MPRSDKNQYYTPGFERGSRVHRMIETGVAGQTGADFIKMLVEDVDKLVHGEPAVVLTGLLAAAKISLNTSIGVTSSDDTAPASTAPIAVQQDSALSRAMRARKSYRIDDDDEE